MKRHTPKRDPVFNDLSFAQRYAKKHLKMAQKFGEEYSRKLQNKGFETGRILDAGCGFGETIICLANNFPDAECSGVDLSEPLLKIANLSAAETNLSGMVDFKKADVQTLPYPDNHFNVVLNINMLHLVADPVKMLNELERVLRDDGYLFIADIRRSWIGYVEPEFRSALTVAEAKALLDKSIIRKGMLNDGFLWWRFEN
jgi:ubiquinone/menaquinone biosynthesis C-methylase UbiE